MVKIFGRRTYILLAAGAVAGVLAFLAVSFITGSLLDNGVIGLPPGRVVPPVNGQGVLHVKMTIEQRGPDGAVRGIQQREYWVDIPGFRARVEKSSSQGPVPEVEVRNGTTFSTLFQGSLYQEQAPSQDTFWLNRIENELWSGYRALSLGAPKRGEAVLDGKQVVMVGIARKDHGAKVGETVVYMDLTNYLPLKEVHYTLTQDGQLVPAGEDIYIYQAVEWLPLSQVPPSIFEPLTLSSTGATQGRWALSLAEAKAFKAFDLYYLGTVFDNLPLQKIEQYKSDTPMPGFQGVDVVYGFAPVVPSDAPRELRITQVSAQVETVGAGLPTPWDAGTKISVKGMDAVLLREGSITGLKLRLGETLIVIWGKDENQVVRAAQGLQKLN